ncbi:MAG TPA: amino acid adenylation domain-containing protein [Vicinamibacteria bacterium]|nr:amino acid adenylation domain-containing protein [Vicinamibacteria bacterium]
MRDPIASSIIDAFEAQAARTPDALAVVQEERELTYRQLRERAENVASTLSQLGVDLEQTVGIALRRSPDAIVALLGVLKSGGCYLPLDPDEAPERSAFMLKDAGVEVLLTEERLAPRFEAKHKLYLDRFDPCRDSRGEELRLRLRALRPQNAAYVIYTSGSTGPPKGVVVPHGALANHTWDAAAAYDVKPSDRCLQTASLAFDTSAEEIYPCLVRGATLVLRTEEMMESVSRFLHAVALGRITVLNLPTAYWHTICQELTAEELHDLAGVRLVVIGGEKAISERLERWHRAGVAARLVNSYGPTEATIVATRWESNGSAGAVVPIGRPISGVEAFVLGADLESIGDGEVGELHLSGAGLARGYRNDPRATAERFVPNPYSRAPGERLYRTGDRVRVGGDGNIEFLGRGDDQVKLSGFRVELGEIESAVREHEAVRDAAVRVDATPNGTRLTAYIVGAPSFGHDETAHLERNLALYEELYAGKTPCDDPAFDTVGWNSSFTDEPIPADEMRQWVDATVERIRSLGARRILEIGCGTGLLLQRLAGEMSEYIGTDFSARSIARLRSHLGRRPELDQVRLLLRNATDFSGVEPGAIDAVVLNSIVQYFPSSDYLMRVLAGAIDVVANGGSIFVGDVRNLALHEEFVSAVKLAKAAPTLPLTSLRRRIRRRLDFEPELLVDPAFFSELPHFFSRVTNIRILVKSGRARNELTQFRYDVVLELDGDDRGREIPWVTWREGMDCDEFGRLLNGCSGSLGVASIPNARLARETRLVELLGCLDESATLSELRNGMESTSLEGLEPGDLEVLAASHGYAVELSWAGGGRLGRFDAFFFRNEEAGHVRRSRPGFPPQASPSRRTNDPLREARSRDLVRELRTMLERRLPRYMIPSSFFVLDALPRGTSGKIDRSRLPAPDVERPELQQPYVPPGTPVEETLCELLAELLGIQSVGALDDFFELGGHSLAAVQLLARVRRRFGREPSLSELFDEPTARGLARRISEADGRQPTEIEHIGALERTVTVPVSFAQERLLFLDGLEGPSSAYNISDAFRIEGDLDVDALERSFRALFERHEALRTTFERSKDETLQRVLRKDQLEVLMRRVDLTHLPGEERWEQARSVIESEASRPFDLEGRPPTHLVLLRVATGEHVLVFTTHHLVSDGWSHGVLYRELSRLYESFVGAGPPLGPINGVQYPDYALWQRDQVEKGRLQEQLEYWVAKLDGLESLDLPTDRPRPKTRSGRGTIVRDRLPSKLGEELAKLSRRRGVSLYMTVLAAFVALLQRYANQEDVAVGAPVANRGREEIEESVGLFVNTIVLRTRVRSKATFTELLAAVRDVSLGGFAHQELPFEKLVEAMRPERASARHPLFQVMFDFQDAEPQVPRLHELLVTPIESHTQGAMFDLTLTVWLDKASLSLALEVDTDLYEPDTAKRMLGHMRRLLEAIVEAPERRLSELSLLTPSERRTLLVQWSTGGVVFSEEPVDRLIAARARIAPETIAVAEASTGKALSFRELDERSNQVAHLLRRRGAGRETLVALSMDRSVETIVSLVGILKAGAAYLALDPSYPFERLGRMLEGSAAGWLLADARSAERFQKSALDVLQVDRDWEWLRHQPKNELPAVTTPHNAAYLIYTSGSSGTPKGALIEHRSLTNHTLSAMKAFGVTLDDRLLQFAPLSFDTCGEEIYPSLVAGATLILCDESMLDPSHFLARLEEERITLATLPTSFFQEVSVHVAKGASVPATLRLLSVGGEKVTRNALARWLAGAPHCRVFNTYGQTEGSMVSHRWEALADTPSDRDPPIGRPIEGVESYVFDQHQEPVPVGVPGDLYIGGVGLARGYLGMPERTAEAFVPHPFARRGTGERLYRTGDRVRLLPDGNLDFLGRGDEQVKIRGYRIEPGEIEAALEREEGVRDAVVVACGEGASRRLVAYVLVEPARAAPTRAIRRRLGLALPPYMVPSALVPLSSWPLTPSGKVDRRALPPPPTTGYSPEGGGFATQSEATVASIWCDVLQIDRIGPHDNFFEHGGHSLLAARVTSRLQDAFGVSLALRELFDHPTVSTLAEALEDSVRARAGVPTLPPLVSATRGDDLALSFAQERLWFLDRLQPASAAYNIAEAFRLTGPLDVQALGEAFVEIERRHDVLRSRFVEKMGRPRMTLGPPEKAPLPIIDLTSLPAEARRAEANDLAEAEAERTFDLARESLLRRTLVKIDEEDHVLLLIVHHIVSDASSQQILHRELGSVYRVLRGGRRSRPAALPIQYADYAAWQKERFEEGAFTAQMEYWRKRLSGLTALEMPMARPRPAISSYRGAEVSIAIPEELVVRLRRLSVAQGCSLFMTILAGFFLVLHRYSGQDDIAVGTAVAYRPRPELEELVGLFANTVVLRESLASDPSFADFLSQVRNTVLEAFAHQDAPFEKLVAQARPERDGSRNPLFQVTFNLTTGSANLELEGVVVEPLGDVVTMSPFDLTLHCLESANGILAELTYAVDLFDEELAIRILRSLERALAEAAAEPRRRLSEIDTLEPTERQRLLVEWQGRKIAHPTETPLHRYVEACARSRPQSIAVAFEDLELSYLSLDRLANAIAHRLRRAGVVEDAAVGICLPRGIPLVVAQLAVLKSGGAYLPLEPEYPDERLLYMLADSRVRVVITNKVLQNRFSSFDGFVLLADDGLSEATDEGPVIDMSPESLAYILYTSGSTGAPKGVGVSHRALVHHMLWMQSVLPLDEDDRVIQKTPFGFDASVWEFWAPLLTGGRVILARPDGHRDPSYLVELIRAHGVTVLQVVPLLLRALLDGSDLGSCHTLRRLCCGGALLSRDLAERFFALGLDAELVNLYGPTEATIHASAAVYRGIRNGMAIDIGRPIDNAEIYLLDASLSPVPMGGIGEIAIGGPGLARGYVNAPRLTAERFVPNPFSPFPGSRLYRSGDLASHGVDGRLQFIGRRDEQVKIRGVRIEPAEIEAALRSLAWVRDAAVVSRELSADDRSLVAHVVLGEGQSVTARRLREELARRLPSVMVPSSFHFVAELPLLPNGKVDRAALARADPGTSLHRRDRVGPEGGLQKTLASIWEDLLGIDGVGVQDDFFELGGHSLLAARVVARVADTTGLDLPLRALFDHPTIETLSRAIHEAGMTIAIGKTVPLERVSREDVLPLSSGQRGLWYLHQLDSGDTSYSMVDAYGFEGSLATDALWWAFDALVERHEALRTVFPSSDGRPRQQVLPPYQVPRTVVDLQALHPDRRKEEMLGRCTVEAHRPFDLEHGPLFRVLLVRLTATEHVLFWSLSHIISDGWSDHVLWRDLAKLYEGYLRGDRGRLPGLSIQAVDFAVWEKRRMRSDELAADMAYWRKKLEGLEPLELPRREPIGSTARARGEVLPVEIHETCLRAIRQLGLRSGVTPYVTFLAAFLAVLHRYSGREDVAVGSPVANRSRSELEDVVGFFVNSIVLRGDLSGDPTFEELLTRIREVALEAFTHQALPFTQLVEEVSPERTPSRHPLFQVSFAWHNQPRAHHKLAGLTVARIELPTRNTPFELELDLYEDGDRVRGELVFDSALFERETIESFVADYQRFLDRVATDPRRRLSELTRLPSALRDRVLMEWGRGPESLDDSAGLYELFESQATRDPNAVAVVSDGVETSYGELASRSRELARELAGMGVGPERVVAVAMERSLESLVALLAVLAAGGVYLPLDSSASLDRLRSMARRACASVLLTCGEDRVRARSLGGRRHVATRGKPRPENLAYVLYTSGSSGRPKGVMVEHRALGNHTASAAREYAIRSSDRVLQFASLSFDTSLEEILPALTRGASLVLRSVDMLDSVPRFLRGVEALGVTVLDLPTAFWHLLASEMKASSLAVPASVRLIIIGGERAFAERLKDWNEVVRGKARLVNSYGPTEATIVTTRCDLGSDRDLASNRIPIGRPIEGASVYILNDRSELVPPGVSGEIYIGGLGVARGYLGEPAETAARFVPDPFSSAPGARMYRTGDRARFLADGQIEFLGRFDRQAKVRGFRVEPEEIEFWLRRQPGVSDAFVAVQRTEGSESTQIVAFLETGARKRTSEEESAVRSDMRYRLPSYMWPTRYVWLDGFPRSPGGKIDPTALAAASGGGIAEDDGRATPTTDVQSELCRIWQAVLRIDRVGIHDNFFALGGDSIVSLQIVAKASQSGLFLTPRMLLEHQTVSELADAVRITPSAEEPRPIPVLDIVPLPPIQKWFFECRFPEPSYFNQFAVLEPSRRLDRKRLEAALSDVVSHHETLRLRYRRKAGVWIQAYGSSQESYRFTVVEPSQFVDGELEKTVARLGASSQAELDLERGPLIQAVLFDPGPGRAGRFLIIIHHLVVDRVSWPILLEDIETAYRQREAGENVRLPRKTSSFPVWAEAIARYAGSRELGAEIPYWTRVVSGVVEVPRDGEGDNTYASAESVVRVLDAETTMRLVVSDHAVGSVRIYELLLASLARALFQWTGRESLVVDLEGHGREDLFDDVDVSRTVGWFTSVFPFALESRDAADVAAVRERLRELPRRGVGFGILRYMRNEEDARGLRGARERELCFNYHGQLDAGSSTSGLFAQVDEDVGTPHAVSGERRYLIEVDAGVSDGKLWMHWVFSRNVHRRTTIDRLATSFVACLRRLSELGPS